MITKINLLNLTKSQLQTIIKQVKEKLNLSITGKNKEQLVDTLFNLHNKNKFFGKKLLSYEDDAHIKLPDRANKAPDKVKIAKRKIKEKLKTYDGALEVLQAKFNKIEKPSLGQIEAYKAKLRVIKKMK